MYSRYSLFLIQFTDMKIHRFYTKESLSGDIFTSVDKETIHQIRTVFRMKNGGHIIVFNGTGTDYEIEITDITTKSISGTIIKKFPTQAPSHKRALALSVLKKDNFELVCQKATELGITDIYPIITDRTIKQQVNADRLQKIIIEAVEQSGRGDIPTLHSTQTLVEIYQHTKDSYTSYVADIGAPLPLRSHHEDTLVYIGPEGGWSDEEKLFFKEKDIVAISLGQFVLRGETAAIATATLLGQ